MPLAAVRTARCIASLALLAYAAVLMAEEEDPPWDRQRPDLPGDEWKRDPEQGSQPDHVRPPPSEQFKRLSAGRVTQQCPKCGSKNLRFDNSLGFWCWDHQQAFTAPMSLEMATLCYAGFFDVRRAA